MASRSTTLEPAGSTGPSSSDAAGRAGAGRYLRVVPVLFALLLASVVALAVSPGLRHQFAQSFTRQDKGYLELFFVNEQAARTCPVDTVANPASPIGAEKRAVTEVGVRSHYDTSRSLAWTVTVDPTRGTVRAQRGRLDVRPGATARFTARVPVAVTTAGSSYTVEVTLAGHTERLLLHC